MPALQRLALLFISLTAVGCASNAGYQAGAIRGSTTLGGQALEWEYHFNRNAIDGFGLVGSKGVALTRAGHVLAFEQVDGVPRLSGHRLMRSSAVAIEERGRDKLLLGTADGRLLWVHPETLDLEDTGIRVQGDIRYVAGTSR